MEENGCSFAEYNGKTKRNREMETERVVYVQELTSTGRQVGQGRTGKATNLPILAVGGSGEEGGYVAEASVRREGARKANVEGRKFP